MGRGRRAIQKRFLVIIHGLFLSINVGRHGNSYTRLLRPPHSVQAFRVHGEIGNITINYKLRNGLFSKFELYQTSGTKTKKH